MKKYLLFFSVILVFLTQNIYASTVYTKIHSSDAGWIGYEHYTVWHNTPVDTHNYTANPNTNLSTFRWAAYSGPVQGTSERRAFLKFDLTSITINHEDIESITLGITYADGHNYAPNSNIAVYSMTGTVASGILTSDFNKIGSTIRMIEPQEVYQNALFEMDVTSIINLNDNYEGFIIRYLAGNDVWGHTFYGDWSTTYYPYLKITYNVIPEPATVLLLGLGIIGIIRKRQG